MSSRLVIVSWNIGRTAVRLEVAPSDSGSERAVSSSEGPPSSGGGVGLHTPRRVRMVVPEQHFIVIVVQRRDWSHLTHGESHFARLAFSDVIDRLDCQGPWGKVGHKMAASTLDVPGIAPRERHPLIVGTFDRLAPGDAFILGDHSPSAQERASMRRLAYGRSALVGVHTSPGRRKAASPSFDAALTPERAPEPFVAIEQAAARMGRDGDNRRHA